MGKSLLKNPIALQLKEILKKNLSGELILEGKTFKKIIYFEKGELVFARSDVIQERLGEILFKTGKLSKTEFWNIHKLMEGKNDKIGKLLVDNNILSKKNLFIGIQIQIKVIAKSLFYLTSGEWEFYKKELDLPEDSKFHKDLAELIIDGSKIIRNTYYYKDIFINHEPYISNNSGEFKPLMDDNLIETINIIETSPGLSNNEIFLKSKNSEEDFWKNIISLFLLDIINFKEISQKKEKDENIEEIISFYEKLKIGKTDYYSILDLEIDASPEEIKERYFIYAKKFHPDRVGNASDPKIREKANFVFSEINRAYDILENPEKRKEYDINKFKKSKDKDTSKQNLKEKASILYRKARTLYNRKQYWEATALLEEAIKNVQDKGSYFLLLGMSQMNIDSMKWSAEKNLSKAAAMEPMNAEPYVALGRLFLNEDMENRSKAFFKKALSIDPENKTALKCIKEISVNHGKKGFFSSKKNI